MKTPSPKILSATFLLTCLTAGLAPAAEYQPDLLVGDSRETLSGGDTYLGGGQKVRIEAGAGGETKFFVRVENDGDLNDTIRLRGRKGNRHFEVSYFDESNGDANITAELIRGNFVTAELATGEGLFIRGEVGAKQREARGKGKGQGRGKGGKRRHFKVRGNSVNDPAARDMVRAFVSTGKKGKKDKPGKP